MYHRFFIIIVIAKNSKLIIYIYIYIVTNGIELITHLKLGSSRDYKMFKFQNRCDP